jgi:hypothetical protein
MTEIFRIQDKDGRGPWKPGFSHNWVEDRADAKNLLPWFDEFGRVDGLVLYGEWCGSGCETIEQIKRWFTPKEYKTLLKYKYNLVKMRVDRILGRSDIQVFFGRSKALNEDFEIVEIY